MKIAILGTRGIPNHYGGFEQFAEIVSQKLLQRGHEVVVYNPDFHEFKGDNYNGVKIRRIYSPENAIGAAANFIYDFLCMKDALKLDFDVILECGYHSNAPSYYLLKKSSGPVVITNMDGLEWKRSKWNGFTRWLIKKLEKLAVKKSHYLVSDNVGIQKYYEREFGAKSEFIAYGAECVTDFNEAVTGKYGFTKGQYFLLIARLEPENNIEMVLDAYVKSGVKCPFAVIGNKNTKYGRYLQNRYLGTNVVFLGSIYDKPDLDSLRCYAAAYFHGHSVGGTNPSLLEAMASRAFIVAHDNEFNRSVLKENALYFDSVEGLAPLYGKLGGFDAEAKERMIDNNIQILKAEYSWDYITDRYERLFVKALEERNGKKSF